MAFVPTTPQETDYQCTECKAMLSKSLLPGSEYRAQGRRLWKFCPFCGAPAAGKKTLDSDSTSR